MKSFFPEAASAFPEIDESGIHHADKSLYIRAVSYTPLDVYKRQVYSFVRIFLPTGIPRMPFYVFLFACFVEVLQYFQLVETLGITNRVARIVLGSTFDWGDIDVYKRQVILSATITSASPTYPKAITGTIILLTRAMR